jgi:hypothetical protein
VIHGFGFKTGHLQNEPSIYGNTDPYDYHETEQISQEHKRIDSRIVIGEQRFGYEVFKGVHQKKEHKTDIYTDVHKPSEKILPQYPYL